VIVVLGRLGINKLQLVAGVEKNDDLLASYLWNTAAASEAVNGHRSDQYRKSASQRA
jgi:hypothetical protein